MVRTEGYLPLEGGFKLLRAIGTGLATVVIPGDALLGADLRSLADDRRYEDHFSPFINERIRN